MRESALFDRQTIAEIQRAAREGIYDIRGFGAKRRVPHFDDLLFLGASMSRYPLEGYRERCDTDVTIGARNAANPLRLDIPVTIAGMSFGALSAPAKEALGRGASAVGTSTTTGDGGMTPEEREHSSLLVYQLLPSRYGMNPDDLRKADAIEIVVGQGAKPGGGGMLLGQKISDRVAEMRDLPKGIDQRSACRHPDWTGPDDLEIKIHELREITDWEKPIFIKVGATRPYFDVALAVKAGADAVVLDGMQGGTAATQEVFIEHVGIPTLAAIRPAVDALQDLDVHREVQLIVSGGIRTGADVAKALALGADAVSIGVAALIALGDNAPELDADYSEIGSAAGFYDDWHEGRDPAGISTQDDELAARFDPELGGRRLANYLRTMVLEAQTLARACGKSHLHNLEPEDLVALTLEASAMARVPLAGTNWIPGWPGPRDWRRSTGPGASPDVTPARRTRAPAATPRPVAVARPARPWGRPRPAGRSRPGRPRRWTDACTSETPISAATRLTMVCVSGAYCATAGGPSGPLRLASRRSCRPGAWLRGNSTSGSAARRSAGTRASAASGCAAGSAATARSRSRTSVRRSGASTGRGTRATSMAPARRSRSCSSVDRSRSCSSTSGRAAR